MASNVCNCLCSKFTEHSIQWLLFTTGKWSYIAALQREKIKRIQQKFLNKKTCDSKNLIEESTTHNVILQDLELLILAVELSDANFWVEIEWIHCKLHLFLFGTKKKVNRWSDQVQKTEKECSSRRSRLKMLRNYNSTKKHAAKLTVR